MSEPLNWPLMQNNILREDLDCLIDFLKQDDPIMTQSKNVKAFEQEWSEWLGCKYSVFVNSGASANFITLGLVRHLYGVGEVIVSPLGWISDYASILNWGMTPVFADIDPKTLSLDTDKVLEKISDRTKAVLMIHIQGFNGLTDRLIDELRKRDIVLIEDVCESHGATHKGKKCGVLGQVSNFSFYYAHHMSSIEGGMISTDDPAIYNMARMFRSHGMVRELDDAEMKAKYELDNPELNPQFIFAYPAFNMRNTELGAVMGRNQLKRLDANVAKRTENLKYFLGKLDRSKYRTEYLIEGSSNYALNVVLKEADFDFRNRVEAALDKQKVEYRRGSAGGGNQLRQPYLKDHVSPGAWKTCPEVDHIHHFGWYIGNFPSLERKKIDELCTLLNSL